MSAPIGMLMLAFADFLTSSERPAPSLPMHNRKPSGHLKPLTSRPLRSAAITVKGASFSIVSIFITSTFHSEPAAALAAFGEKGSNAARGDHNTLKPRAHAVLIIVPMLPGSWILSRRIYLALGRILAGASRFILATAITPWLFSVAEIVTNTSLLTL